MIGCWISSLVLVLRVRRRLSWGRKFVCVDQNPPAIEVMAKRLGVDPVSFAEYRGVPRGASVLFTPKRTVGVRGGTSRDALTAASVMR